MRVERIGDATRWVRIYALCEPNGDVRYVGKTVRYLHERHKQHIHAAAKARLPVQRWIAKKIAAEDRLCIQLLENVAPDACWKEREKHWIQHYRSSGAKLLNLTDGGEGLTGHVFTEEHRQKIAAGIRTGKQLACEICETLFWRSKSEIAKGDCRFCSRQCYHISTRGKLPAVWREATDKGIAAAAAKRRAQTHCKNGHPLSGENLYLHPSGSRRVCKTCLRKHKAEYRARGGRG